MKNNLCWIRRDLRLTDHFALSESLKKNEQTFIVFIFDENILSKLPKQDRRITFIIESLIEIEKELNKFNSSLIIKYGDPANEIEKLITELKIDNLYFNRDYEPDAKRRDLKIVKLADKLCINVYQFKDHVFYENHELRNNQNEIYKVFTPYKNKWLTKFSDQEKQVPNYKVNLAFIAKFLNQESILKIDWFLKLGFTKCDNSLNGGEANANKQLFEFKKYISEYEIARDYPSLEKTSQLSPYIRMGNISIRKLITLTQEQKNRGSEIYLSEIIWREFYQSILDEFPNVQKSCFKVKYNQLKYINNSHYLESWKNGVTGFPIIDAAMRCLNETGFMHNRLRMIVASFLTKTLLIDWRIGENYFSLKLLDYDMAANNGGWQWSASTGVDAQPYFRIFNPYNQSEKFDKNGDFIRIWCPELRNFSNKQIHFPQDAELCEQEAARCIVGIDYPKPIVSYKSQKIIALKMFKEIIN